jgi:hypothetical protein
MILRDKFWLWGHPEGRYNLNADNFGCPDVSRMSPMEACSYLGIRNTFMVPVGVKVNKRQYNKSFKTLNQVGWECFDACEKPELVDEIINEAKDFKNISCVVIDDFKIEEKGVPRYKRLPVSMLKDLNEKLHNNDVRRLDSWMVLYTFQFGENEEEYLELLEMPETFILYRFFFKWLDSQNLKGTQHWRCCWNECMNSISQDEKDKLLEVIHKNVFNDEVKYKFDNPLIVRLLEFYTDYRKDIITPGTELYKLKKVYDLNPIKELRKASK